MLVRRAFLALRLGDSPDGLWCNASSLVRWRVSAGYGGSERDSTGGDYRTARRGGRRSGSGGSGSASLPLLSGIQPHDPTREYVRTIAWAL